MNQYERDKIKIAMMWLEKRNEIWDGRPEQDNTTWGQRFATLYGESIEDFVKRLADLQKVSREEGARLISDGHINAAGAADNLSDLPE